MTQQSIQMVVVDLDGTLLDSTSNPTPDNLTALRRVHDRGVVCAIASGRDVYSIAELIRSWGMEDVLDLVIGQNGAEVLRLSTAEVATSHTVEPAAFRAAIDHFEGMDLNFCFAERGVYVCPREDRFSKNLQDAGNFKVGFDPGFERILSQPQIKLHLMCDPADMPAIRERAATFSDPRLRGLCTGPYLYEFQHPQVSKAVGLPLAKHLADLPVNAGVMCFGDAENDLEMIRAATVGVAMANAHEPVKQAATHHTASNDENGVARFLNDWFTKLDA